MIEMLGLLKNGKGVRYLAPKGAHWKILVRYAKVGQTIKAGDKLFFLQSSDDGMKYIFANKSGILLKVCEQSEECKYNDILYVLSSKKKGREYVEAVHSDNNNIQETEENSLEDIHLNKSKRSLFGPLVWLWNNAIDWRPDYQRLLPSVNGVLNFSTRFSGKQKKGASIAGVGLGLAVLGAILLSSNFDTLDNFNLASAREQLKMTLSEALAEKPEKREYALINPWTYRKEFLDEFKERFSIEGASFAVIETTSGEVVDYLAENEVLTSSGLIVSRRFLSGFDVDECYRTDDGEYLVVNVHEPGFSAEHEVKKLMRCEPHHRYSSLKISGHNFDEIVGQASGADSFSISHEYFYHISEHFRADGSLLERRNNPVDIKRIWLKNEFFSIIGNSSEDCNFEVKTVRKEKTIRRVGLNFRVWSDVFHREEKEFDVYAFDNNITNDLPPSCRFSAYNKDQIKEVFLMILEEE